MPNMNMNNTRKSPVKQQRIKHSHSIPVANTNAGRMRSTSSMASSYPRMYNNHHQYHYQHYSNTTSPTAMSASSLPAVPLFYSNTYADPPECSTLPPPPESWYLSDNVDSQPVPTEEDKSFKKDKEIPSTIKTKSFSSSLQASKQIIPRTCYYTNNNQGFYSPYYSSTSTNANSPGPAAAASYQKFPTQYISVKA